MTSAVSERLVAGGSLVMLFADAANPTSNAVYHRLGYEDVDVFVRQVLATPDDR